MIRARSQGREAALTALYQLDLSGELGDASVEPPIRDEEAPLEDARAFAKTIVAGVRKHVSDLDVELETVAINWQVERMAVIDRNVLRIGAYELLHSADVPAAVAINEAVILAQKFSTKDSGAFVNGVLDRIRERADMETE
jgi:N utilization substance protein B